MAKKWPEKIVQRSFIKEHSFPNSLYVIDQGFRIDCIVVKSKEKISQNFVAFSEYMNFNLM